MLFTFAAYILDIVVNVFSQSILNSMNSISYNWDRSLQKFFSLKKAALNRKICTVNLGHNLDILQKIKSTALTLCPNILRSVSFTVTWRISHLKIAEVVTLFYLRLIAQFVSLLFLPMIILLLLIFLFEIVL